MQFLTNTVLGLLVLSALVSCYPAGEEVPQPTDVSPSAVPNSSSSSAAEKKEENTTVMPSRAQNPSTEHPPLQHNPAPSVENAPAAPQVANEQKPTEKPMKSQESAASSHTQVFSLVLSSVAVLLLSAI